MHVQWYVLVDEKGCPKAQGALELIEYACGLIDFNEYKRREGR